MSDVIKLCRDSWPAFSCRNIIDKIPSLVHLSLSLQSGLIPRSLKPQWPLNLSPALPPSLPLHPELSSELKIPELRHQIFGLQFTQLHNSPPMYIHVLTFQIFHIRYSSLNYFVLSNKQKQIYYTFQFYDMGCIFYDLLPKLRISILSKFSFFWGEF